MSADIIAANSKSDHLGQQVNQRNSSASTHSRDERPGDITGTRFTGSGAWRPIMRSGEPMQGTGGN